MLVATNFNIIFFFPVFIAPSSTFLIEGVPISKTYSAKVAGAPQNLGVSTFPDPVIRFRFMHWCISWPKTNPMYVKSLKRLRCPKTSATKVVLVLVAQWGICSAPCVLRQYTVVFRWKCRLFYLCVPGQCRVYHIYYGEFHFRFEVISKGHFLRSSSFLRLS